MSATVTDLDCGLSKPQLMRVMQKCAEQASGMHQIAKALSQADMEFAQEAFDVFATNLDHIACALDFAVKGDQEYCDVVFGAAAKRAR